MISLMIRLRADQISRRLPQRFPYESPLRLIKNRFFNRERKGVARACLAGGGAIAQRSILTVFSARTHMKKTSIAIVFLVLGAGEAQFASQSERGGALPSFAEPGISADGSTIAFVSGGDIWEVLVRGGDARLLVSHQATESRPLFSPDGRRLAFSSSRSGGGDVYVLTLT